MRIERYVIKVRDQIRKALVSIAEPLEYIKAQKETFYKAAILFLILLFLWRAYEGFWISLFDKYVLSCLNVSWGWVSFTLYTLIICGIVYQLVQCFKHKHILSMYHLSIYSVLIIVYTFYRFSAFHKGYQDFSSLYYLDLLVLGLLVLVVSAISNFIIVLMSEQRDKPNTNFFMIPDQPITTDDDDRLDYAPEARMLAETISGLKLNKSLSIGVTSQWGSGKTSYLNLVEQCLDRNLFIIIKFNPRYSKNVACIQEDFFSIISSALKPYNSCFSKMFKNYMETLQLFDDKNIVTAILNLKGIVDRDSEKEKLDMALKILPKKVVVFLEDFDRLFKEEIIEVFKLIDGNAAFPNLVFLTAYDKAYIVKTIGSNLEDGASLFSDKFFDMEVVVPLRPYQQIFDFLSKHLLEGLNCEVGDEHRYQTALEKHFYVIKRYLITLRDVKRFLNLFINDYKFVKGEVNFEDYFLLTIIKFKDSEEYKELGHNHKNISNEFGRYCFDNNGGDEIKFADILNILFPPNFSSLETDSELRDNFRRINSTASFNNYFFNRIYNQLRLSDMEECLRKDFMMAKLDIDNWIENNLIGGFVEFLQQKNLLCFDNKERFIVFMQIVFYLSLRLFDTEVYILILRLVTVEHIKQFEQRYTFSQMEYKILISEILNEGYPCFHYRIIQKLILNLCNGELVFEIIYTKEELINIARKLLKGYISENETMCDVHMDILYSCVKDVNQETRKVTLDEDSCLAVRNLIFLSPGYYISTFVRLGMFSSNPDMNSIACEPYWKQIFGEAQTFETFILGETLNSIPEIQRVRNFWKLYSNNDYEPIPMERMGNVQKMINDNLVILMPLFENIQAIERKFKEIQRDYDVANPQESIDKCQLLKQKIGADGLFIAKNGQLIRQIDQWISGISGSNNA